jgi:thiosulfate dehydrogenase (quinone) large subunit
MNRSVDIVTLLLRFSMGWYFFYAGIAKVVNPEWSSLGYLGSAETFGAVYQWFASPANIGWVDFLNQWGLTLIGLALIFGIFVRLASVAGIVLMALYYFPVLDFPYAGPYSLIVDDHILIMLVLVYLIAARAGMYWGLEGILARSPFGSNPLFNKLFG